MILYQSAYLPVFLRRRAIYYSQLKLTRLAGYIPRLFQAIHGLPGNSSTPASLMILTL
jgi:hypothetical protein